MNESTKWDEMTNEQRDAIIHEKVMSATTVCPGKLIASRVDVPSRAGGTAYTYWELACDTCETVGYSDSEDAIPKEHPTKVDIPKYSTDMNAACQIVERFDEIIISRHIPGKYHCELWRSTTRFISVAKTPQDAICKAALQAMGVEIDE